MSHSPRPSQSRRRRVLSGAVGLWCWFLLGANGYAATSSADLQQLRWGGMLRPLLSTEQPDVIHSDPPLAPLSPFGKNLDVTVWGLSWVSTGRTKNSDNASVLSPLLGNPTSTLNFDEVASIVFETGLQIRIANDWFGRVAYGRGDINTGRLVDDDFVTEPIGLVDVKGKGEVETWRLVGPRGR
jgi:hypothetical protein